jgi:MSHA biogenesis protein MshK
MSDAARGKRRFAATSAVALARASAVAFALCAAAVATRAGATVRDPTRPPQAAPVAGAPVARAAPLPEVTAVMGAPGRRVAIVEGRLVRVGDAVAGGTVEDIDADGIRWRRGDAIRELRLPAPPTVKRPARTAVEQ